MRTSNTVNNIKHSLTNIYKKLIFKKVKYSNNNQISAIESAIGVRDWIIAQIDSNFEMENSGEFLDSIELPIILSRCLFAASNKYDDLLSGDIIIESALELLSSDKSLSQHQSIIHNISLLLTYQYVHLISKTETKDIGLTKFEINEDWNYNSEIIQMMVLRLSDGGEFGQQLNINNDAEFKDEIANRVSNKLYEKDREFGKTKALNLFNIVANTNCKTLETIKVIRFKDNPAIFESVLSAEYDNRALFKSTFTITAIDLYDARMREQVELDIIRETAIKLRLQYSPIFIDTLENNESMKFFDAADEYIKSLDQLRLKILAIGGYWGGNLSNNIVDPYRQSIAESRECIIRGYLFNGDADQDKLMEEYVHVRDEEFTIDANKSRIWLCTIYDYIPGEKLMPYAVLNYESCISEFGETPEFMIELESARHNRLVS